MLFLIVPAIIGIALGIKEAVEWRDGWFSYPLLYFILGLAIGFFLLIVPVLIGYGVYEFEEYNEQAELCSFKDSTKIEGKKYLFSGYMDEKLIYRYVINTEYGKQIKESQFDNYTYIKEIENINKAYIKTYYKKAIVDNKWKLMIAFPFDDKVRTVFEVPTGTVTQEYNIDLE